MKQSRVVQSWPAAAAEGRLLPVACSLLVKKGNGLARSASTNPSLSLLEVMRSGFPARRFPFSIFYLEACHHLLFVCISPTQSLGYCLLQPSKLGWASPLCFLSSTGLFELGTRHPELLNSMLSCHSR